MFKKIRSLFSKLLNKLKQFTQSSELSTPSIFQNVKSKPPCVDRDTNSQLLVVRWEPNQNLEVEMAQRLFLKYQNQAFYEQPIDKRMKTFDIEAKTFIVRSIS